MIKFYIKKSRLGRRPFIFLVTRTRVELVTPP